MQQLCQKMLAHVQMDSISMWFLDLCCQMDDMMHI